MKPVSTFNYEKLRDVVMTVTKNLDKVIDIKHPIPETRRSNMRHRPIGIGVQGLADVFALLNMPFGSPEAEKVNQNIFETIYYGAMKMSCDLGKTPRASFEENKTASSIFV